MTQTAATEFGSPTAAPLRNYEVAALRADGSLYIGQDNAPALPLFEAAFAAFARGTLIQTVLGDIAIEDLQPGDMINTSSGEPAQLIWIGSSNFIPADTGRRLPLIRIMPDSFGEGRPSSFLTLGPAARVLHTPHHLRAEAGGTRLLTPVREFVDGVNVIEVSDPGTPVPYLPVAPCGDQGRRTGDGDFPPRRAGIARCHAQPARPFSVNVSADWSRDGFRPPHPSPRA